jgi:hypothetical protein
VNAVSMTPLAFLKIRISLRIRIYIRKALAPKVLRALTPLNQGPKWFNEKKPRVENLVTLSL